MFTKGNKYWVKMCFVVKLIGYGSIISMNVICKKTIIVDRSMSKNLLDVSESRVQIVQYFPSRPKRESIIVCIIRK